MNRQRRAEVAEFRPVGRAGFSAKWNFAFWFSFFLMAKPFTPYPISFSTNEARMAEFSVILVLIAFVGGFLLGYAARAAVSAHRRRKAYRWRHFP